MNIIITIPDTNRIIFKSTESAPIANASIVIAKLMAHGEIKRDQVEVIRDLRNKMITLIFGSGEDLSKMEFLAGRIKMGVERELELIKQAELGECRPS
jgi:hypothetical protein